jgi:hypothetical protein
MPPPTPATGYVPTFHMPAIAPPPAGVDPALYYGAVTAATTLQVTTAAHLGLKLTLSNAAYSPLFAMVGGVVAFVPPGKPLFAADASPSPGTGSLCIWTLPVDANILRKKLPPGVPPPTKVLYLNVRPSAVRNALQPFMQGLPLDELKAAWNKPSAMPGRAGLETNYLDRVMLGEKAVFVQGGTLIGQAERIDPNDTASAFETTLRFTDGAGNDLSPLLHLRSMPGFGARWVGHPLVAATANTPVPVNIYLRFEVWNKTSQKHVPLPAGVAVDLMDYDSVSSNEKLATQLTDAQGEVHFSIPNVQILDEPEPDLFFLIHTNQLSYAGHTLPQEWSTKGWKDKSGKPGYYEAFKGTQLGDAADPLTFRIGVDFHAQFEYRHDPSGTDHPAPKGIPVSLWVVGVQSTPKAQLETDENGQVHGVAFDIDPDDSVYYVVDFEIADTAINLPRARIHTPTPHGWATHAEDADKKYYPDNDRTSLGSHQTPDVFRCTLDERNVALYFLKILREHATFLYHITGGAWTGINNLVMARHSISGRPYSWPVGVVNLPASDHWDRATIVHELSHQVMWKEVGFSNATIVQEFGPAGELHGNHFVNSLFNAEHALIEGWADFIAVIFEGFYLISFFSAPVDEDQAALPGGLGPPPLNRGEEIEGVFTRGLWAIFKEYVVTPAVSSTARVFESANGDVTTKAPWIGNTSVQSRFLSMIWKPLQDLKTLSDPTTSDMHAKIAARNTSTWHLLMAELQALNEAMLVPTANYGSISPATGPAAGGQPVTITGANFIAKKGGTIGGVPIETSVTIGGLPATNVSVVSSTTLTAVTPAHPPGNATLVITTPAGSATVPGVYLYV